VIEVLTTSKESDILLGDGRADIAGTDSRLQAGAATWTGRRQTSQAE